MDFLLVTLNCNLGDPPPRALAAQSDQPRDKVVRLLSFKPSLPDYASWQQVDLSRIREESTSSTPIASAGKTLSTASEFEEHPVENADFL